MLLSKDKEISTILSSIQRVLMYVLLVILPISVLPFPWDSTEKGMTIIIITVTVFIFLLEIVKVIWSGKIVFLNSNLDILIFALLVSYILTTLFASDFNLSFFGFNYRLGAGLLGIGSVILLSLLIRSFLSTKKELGFLINSFLIGSIIVSFLSLLSLFGANIFSIFPQISSLGMVGLPIIGSPVVLVVYNSVAIFLAYISIITFKDHKIGDYRWLSFVSIFINILAISFFSIDQRALVIVALLIIVLLSVLITIFLKDKSSPKEKLVHLILPVSIIVPVLLMQINPISSFILGQREIVSPLNLSVDFSWNIVVQALMRSLKNGIFGEGLDSFGVIFTALKPIELLNLDILSAYNEILTSLSNSGFLWLVIWFMIGWYIIRDFLNDLKEYDKKSFSLIFFDALIIFVYLASFFITYTIILRFVFFLLLSIWIVLRNIFKSDQVNNTLIKIWAMGSKKGEENSLPTVPIVLTFVFALLSTVLFVYIGRITLSSLYLLRAESYIISENKRFDDREATDEEKEVFVDNLHRLYAIAHRYDSNNPVVNRKLSLASVDKLGILISKYQTTQDSSILNDAVFLRNEAFEYSRKAVKLSPSLYSSYNNRAMVYLGVINLGYTEYIRDGLAVLEDAVRFKPLDYQNHYYKGQLYYLLQDYEKALESSTRSLTIKGDFIPSLILSASINGVQGNTEIQLSYLQAAVTILEQYSLQATDVYRDIAQQIETIIEETGIEIPEVNQEVVLDEDLESEEYYIEGDLGIDKLP